MATAAVAAGASVLGGVLGGKGAKKAARIQAAAADRATAAQQAQFDKQVQLQEPFRQAGLSGESKLLQLLGLNPGSGSGLSVDQNATDFGKYAKDFSMSDFEQDPGYAFRVKEGTKALNNSMASLGRGISGASIKGAINYGQEAGSQEYQNAFNRYQVNRSNQINPLQSLFGAGQSTANTLSNAAQNLGNNQAELQLQAGNARASGYVGQANALTNAISGGINAYTGIQNSSALNSFLNRASTPTGGGTFGGGRNPDGSMSFGVDNYNYGMGG